MRARTGFFMAAALMLLFFSGCAGLIGRLKVTDTPKAAAARAALSEINSHLTAFKGLGRIGFGENGARKRFRVAFMAKGESMLRMDVLPIPGNPGASFSTDGRLFYIQDRRPGGGFVMEEASAANLGKLISIDISPKDVIRLLAGRPPILPHDGAVFSQNNSTAQKELLLKKGWGRTVEKIRFEPDTLRLLAVEVLDPGGGFGVAGRAGQARGRSKDARPSGHHRRRKPAGDP